MRIDKNSIYKLILGAGIYLANPIASIASGFTPPNAQRPEPGSLPVDTGVQEGTSLITAISTVINWALGFVGIVVFIIFLYAGFQYATAGGDESKTNNARSSMINAVIGMIIVFLTFVISNAVLAFAFGAN